MSRARTNAGTRSTYGLQTSFSVKTHEGNCESAVMVSVSASQRICAGHACELLECQRQAGSEGSAAAAVCCLHASARVFSAMLPRLCSCRIAR